MPYKDRARQRAAQADYARKAKRAKRDYIAKLKRLVIDAKESRPCADCSRSYPFYVMQFDHVRGLKKFEINEIMRGKVRGGRRALLDEMAKCDIVCANCHAARTYRRHVDGVQRFLDLVPEEKQLDLFR